MVMKTKINKTFKLFMGLNFPSLNIHFIPAKKNPKTYLSLDQNIEHQTFETKEYKK